MIYSMLGGMFDSIVAVVKELFNFIPKIMYLLYASLASVLDVLQLFFRKIAGLDVYYVNGEPQTGDLVTNFIGGILGFTSDGFSYSALTTVFWAFVVFGVIMVFISTFVAVIKSHYNYDDKAAKGPMQYVYTAGKAVINIVAVPVIVFIGLFVSQALLGALDSLTSTSSGTISSLYGTTTIQVEENGVMVDKVVSRASQDLMSSETSTGGETYVYYDLFGVSSGVVYNAGVANQASEEELSKIASSNVTFSGQLFKLAAYNGNRARIGEYTVKTGSTGTNAGNFTGGNGSLDTSGLNLFDGAEDNDDLADMIDTAFASNLHLKESVELIYKNDSFSQVQGIDQIRQITAFRSTNFNAFSKFNIGLVWYYYDLWQFNFIIGFAACIVCAILFINIIIGLITRLFMCIGLFLVAPPLFGLSPIDGGKAGKSWTENFVKQVLMAYGAVVGMNIFFLILPYINNIDFFNVPIADYFAQALILITGLVTVKAFIAMVSGLIGGADANETGGKVAKEVGEVAGKATKMTAGAAKFAINPIGNTYRAAAGAVRMGVGKVQEIAGGISEKARKLTGRKRNVYEAKENMLSNLEGKNVNDINKADFMDQARSSGVSKRHAREMWRGVQTQVEAARGAHETTFSNDRVKNARRSYNNFARRGGDKNYRDMHDSNWETWYDAAGNEHQGFSAAFQTRQANHRSGIQQAKNTQRYGRARIEKGSEQFGKSGIMHPLAQVDSIMGGSDLYKSYKEGVLGKKPDDAKKTADNTERLIAVTEEMSKKIEEIDEKLPDP